ncbi:hypothetical protein ERJ75_000437900 [Trypanosoma vivax]|nr:hypothetical protein ERJ75_000437900 [Trypanosoma vivax]
MAGVCRRSSIRVRIDRLIGRGSGALRNKASRTLDLRRAWRRRGGLRAGHANQTTERKDTAQGLWVLRRTRGGPTDKRHVRPGPAAAGDEARLGGAPLVETQRRGP